MKIILRKEKHLTMNSLKCESPPEGGENIEKRSSPQSDRFSRRLNKYRIHQSDCRVKSDHSLREACEQESLHIRQLQSQKVTEGKQKRAVKKATRKGGCNVSLGSLIISLFIEKISH